MKDETRVWLDSLSPSINDGSVLQQHANRPSNTLSDAASSGNVPLLVALLRINPSRTPEQIEEFLQQALRIAIYHKQLNTVQFLMQYLCIECMQTMLSKPDLTSESPFHHAIRQTSLPIVRCIFETYPAALHQKYKSHLSPFQFALLFNTYADIVHYFLDAMPDPIKQDTLKNAFHYVSSYDMAAHLHKLDPTLIDQLSDGRTTAYSAIQRCYDVLRFILHLRPNQMTSELLFVTGSRKEIELMLSLKPNILGTDDIDNQNVLHVVAKYVRKPQLIADVLVHCSHYLEQCDRFNSTPYKHAVCANNTQAMDAYEQYLSFDVVFDTCVQHTSNFKANMARVCLKVRKQCRVLDTLLLPELNAIVQSYIKR